MIKKKYLIFGNGGSAHILKWVKGLIKHYEVYLITTSHLHPEMGLYIDNSKIYNLGLAIDPEGGNLKILKSFFKVRKILLTLKPDFFNPHYLTSHGFIAALIKKTTITHWKLIQTTWGTDILVTPQRNLFYRAITKFSLNQAHLITSDSSHMTGVIRHLSHKPVETFVFGLDQLPKLDPDTKNTHLYFSNRMLAENYNIDTIMRFFSQIAASQPKARLIISHSGHKESELKTLSKQLGLDNRIDFVGFISEEEQASIYAQAQFYLSIPTSDSTSVSLLEAMAYGCIPVVSDLPANREWIEDNKNGIIFSSQTSVNTLGKILLKRKEVAQINRDIISEKAIFPDSIENFVCTLNKL